MFSCTPLNWLTDSRNMKPLGIGVKLARGFGCMPLKPGPPNDYPRGLVRPRGGIDGVVLGIVPLSGFSIEGGIYGDPNGLVPNYPSAEVDVGSGTIGFKGVFSEELRSGFGILPSGLI